jgi:hypothetical protein
MLLVIGTLDRLAIEIQLTRAVQFQDFRHDGSNLL